MKHYYAIQLIRTNGSYTITPVSSLRMAELLFPIVGDSDDEKYILTSATPFKEVQIS